MEDCGYAGFGVTVILYTIISSVILVPNMLCQEYPAANSEYMAETEKYGGIFDRTVRTVVPERQSDHGCYHALGICDAG